MPVHPAQNLSWLKAVAAAGTNITTRMAARFVAESGIGWLKSNLDTSMVGMHVAARRNQGAEISGNMGGV